MRVIVTEALFIDLDSERWGCRRCTTELGSARKTYKEGLLVYDRDPREIHRPILDPTRYAFTFAPDPLWVRILEYYCPACGLQVEAEYLPPGHPPTRDLEFDVDALRAQWRERAELSEPALGPDFERPRHSHGHDVQGSRS
jgi:acetone carboxylase gamma subunit